MITRRMRMRTTMVDSNHGAVIDKDKKKQGTNILLS
jgi:hypothetical protein